MADEHTSASFPVASDSIQAELRAAFARIADVPASRTLIDDLANDLWHTDVTENIAIGSAKNDEDELDHVDHEVKEIA